MGLTFEQLPKAVEEVLEALHRLEALLNINQSTIVDNDATILTVKEAAKFLNLSSSRIYKYTFLREIPHVKKGKRVYFIKSELIEWVKLGRVKTSYDIEQEARSYIIKSSNRKIK